MALKKISDLKIGEVGWTVPWAVTYDLDGKIRVGAAATWVAARLPNTTTQVGIRRNALGDLEVSKMSLRKHAIKISTEDGIAFEFALVTDWQAADGGGEGERGC